MAWPSLTENMVFSGGEKKKRPQGQQLTRPVPGHMNIQRK